MNKTASCILNLVIKIKENYLTLKKHHIRALFASQGDFITVIQATVSASITSSDQRNIQSVIACRREMYEEESKFTERRKWEKNK